MIKRSVSGMNFAGVGMYRNAMASDDQLFKDALLLGTV
jgi:hypothetical protein